MTLVKMEIYLSKMPTKENEKNNEAEFLKNKAKGLTEESISASPGRLSEINIELTAIKSFFSEKLDNILVFKADMLEKLRAEHKTSAAANSAWKALREGKNEIILRGIISRIKDQVSVNKSRLNVLHDEAFGQY